VEKNFAVIGPDRSMKSVTFFETEIETTSALESNPGAMLVRLVPQKNGVVHVLRSDGSLMGTLTPEEIIS
jgi:hypothetical protein